MKTRDAVHLTCADLLKEQRMMDHFRKLLSAPKASTEASDEESLDNVAHRAGRTEEVFGDARRSSTYRDAVSSHAVGPRLFADAQEGKDETGMAFSGPTAQQDAENASKAASLLMLACALVHDEF